MKRNIVIAAVTAAALIGGGTATALAAAGDDDGAAARKTDVRVTGDDDSARVASGTVTAADAIATALKEAPGTAVSAELDDDGDDDGPAQWKVRVLAGDDTWHKVRIDPASGKVLGSHTGREDDDDDIAEVRAALKGTSVTAAEAAAATASKGTVTDIDLDDDGRSKAWEVETHPSGKDDRDYRVDLNTGKVTADTDDDSHDDRGADDDGDDD
ncbi:PepSY domain-containing protein [Streptomyces sp. GESEQ-35]|uniref:PepSY domain-containing protein n=1 Tax=Streptomyces sp. GESEQ-35 TaxID=2812657 RepID=UPI001B32BC2E|nr:PepSY domain-containing protein [Streptomyces sp. GESEQ-35]